MNTRNSLPEKTDTLPARALDRVWDAFIFVGFLILSALAIAAVAIATPLVLAISVVAGLLNKNGDGSAWRPARA